MYYYLEWMRREKLSSKISQEEKRGLSFTVMHGIKLAGQCSGVIKNLPSSAAEITFFLFTISGRQRSTRQKQPKYDGTGNDDDLPLAIQIFLWRQTRYVLTSMSAYKQNNVKSHRQLIILNRPTWAHNEPEKKQKRFYFFICFGLFTFPRRKE